MNEGSNHAVACTAIATNQTERLANRAQLTDAHLAPLIEALKRTEQFDGMELNRRIFIDESGAQTKMGRLRGRSIVGQRLVGHLPHGHWKTCTMISAIGLQRAEVYIANIVKCRPPKNRDPERDEIETCSPFLERQIEGSVDLVASRS